MMCDFTVIWTLLHNNMWVFHMGYSTTKQTHTQWRELHSAWSESGWGIQGWGQVQILKITANDFIRVADYWENKAMRAMHEH